MITLLTGDCREILPTLPAASVQTVVTSPPYYGLRDYGTGMWEGGDPDCSHIEMLPDWTRDPGDCDGRISAGHGTAANVAKAIRRSGGVCRACGATLVDRQIGREPIPDSLGWARAQAPCGQCYVCALRAVFAAIWPALRDDGTAWLNLGDSYASDTKWGGATSGKHVRPLQGDSGIGRRRTNTGLPDKSLMLIPSRVALALQADGWVVRSDIVWCLSGGTWVYTQTQKGTMPMMVKDLARLDPATVRLWNGEKWTQLLGLSRSPRSGKELEIVLRSGERIACTPTHQFPTQRGLLTAGELVVGDVLQTTQLPDNDNPRDCAIDEDAAWLAGLYIAEGSRSGSTISLAGHVKETARWERIQRIARKFGGSASLRVNGNRQVICVNGKVLNALIDELVTGKVAHDKGFAPVVWRYSNHFIAAMVDGYLSGDGGFDKKNNRWRLGFARNYNLERDLRTACARLGYRLVLNLSSVPYNGQDVPIFRGELRVTQSGHPNEKKPAEVVAIRKSRCRTVWDLGVADEPHLFALASGVLTHNSKPSAMPESVKDRPTRAHETIYLLAKNSRYYYDAAAVAEPAVSRDRRPPNGSTASLRRGETHEHSGRRTKQDAVGSTRYTGFNDRYIQRPQLRRALEIAEQHNLTQAHLDAIRAVGLGDAGQTASTQTGTGANTAEVQRLAAEAKVALGGYYREFLLRDTRNLRDVWTINPKPSREGHYAMYPEAIPERCIRASTRPGDMVLDPFGGSGTTGRVAERLGRHATLIELNPDYTSIQERRLDGVQREMLFEGMEIEL